MTNLEGRVIRRKKALPPPSGVLDDLQLLKALADRLGRGQFFSDEPHVVFDELRRASAGGIADYSGITYERIEAEMGVFWPCPGIGHPGTPRMFTDIFPTPDGRARFLAVEHREPAESPDVTYPLVLTTGRLMSQYQSGTQTRRVPGPALQQDPHAQIHPDLARRLGVETSDIVQLRSARGTANFRAYVSDDIRVDTVFVPFHWGGVSCANALTNPVLDPLSKMPEFKACAVALERIGSSDDGHLLATSLAAPTSTRHPPALAARSPRHPPAVRRQSREDNIMAAKNVFLQGIYPFEGVGIDKPVPISSAVQHVVPDGFVAQTLYFRGGNTSNELISVALLRDGVPMRYFPIGAKADVHVPLRVVEDLEGGTMIELHVAAPEGLTGTLILDVGLVEF